MSPIPPTEEIPANLYAYWVLPGRLLAGAHPCFVAASEAPELLRSLADSGVEVFLDLTEEGEAAGYDSWVRSQTGPSGRPSDYFRLGFRDMSVPSVQHMARVLDRVDDALREGRATYVHCLGGLGRTGMVVGCHLVRHGIAGDEALVEIERLRQPLKNAFSLSPVTNAQRRFVYDWRIGS